MKIDLKELGVSGISIERTIPAAGFPPSTAAGIDSPFRLLADGLLKLAANRVGERYHLHGSLSAEVEAECCRCLTTFSFAVRPKFDYYLVPRRLVEEGAELEIDDTAKCEVEVDSLELDLLHLADEQVRLGLPMKLLCSDDCQGICLCCGADLNRESCNCTGDDPDNSGLAALSGLLERMNNDSSEN